MSIDTAFEEFKLYQENVDQYGSVDLSESDTRSKLLDTIFINVLGWSENDIQREGHIKGGYYDYRISTANVSFICEAKRSLDSFVLPDTLQRAIKIETLMKGNQELVSQIRRYLVDHGLTYGVVSNGRQFIVGKFININGKPWEKNRCFVFRDLKDIEKNFIKFYNLLSKESVAAKGSIPLDTQISTGDKISESLEHKKIHDRLIRNDLSSNLLPIVESFFEELAATEDMKDVDLLRACYVKNDDIKKNNAELNILFSDQPPTFTDKSSPSQHTQNIYEDIGEKLGQTGKTPNPIVIIGGKGVGKTTFIRYFLQVELGTRERYGKPCIYLDFENYTDQELENTEEIYHKMTEKLILEYPKFDLDNISTLKKVFKDDIARKKKGIWSCITDEKDLEKKIAEFIENQQLNKISYLEKIASYLLDKKGKRLCVIFDNADQLPDLSQEKIFLLTHSVSQKLRCIVMVSLREGYYYKWKNKPPFDVFNSTVYHIAPPPYSTLLEKRVDYVLSHYDFSKSSGNYSGKSVQVGEESMKMLFESLRYTIFDDPNTEVLDFLGQTSYPDMREMLKKFKLFLTSGHTKLAEYMVTSQYKIPIWEFCKAVALESHHYYDTEVSIVHNLLYPHKTNKNHFTKVRLLKYLAGVSKKVSFTTNYIPCEKIVQDFAAGGYTEAIILSEMTELIRYRLVETQTKSVDTSSEDEMSINSEVRLTQSGHYYFTKMITRFFYIDLILQDTPIYDKTHFGMIRSVFPEVDHTNKRNLYGRVETAKRFLEYLAAREEYDHIHCGDSGCGLEALDMSIVKHIRNNGFDRDLRRIKATLGNISG